MTDQIEVFRQELAAHRGELRRYREEIDERFVLGEKRFDQIIKCQNDTCTTLAELVQNTAELVTVIKEVKGAVPLVSRIQKVGVWLLTRGTIGYGLYSWSNPVSLRISTWVGCSTPG